MDFYPSQEFWESDLEVPARNLFNNFKNFNARQDWLNSLSNKQVNVIFDHYFKDGQSGQLFKDCALWKRDSNSERQALINVSDSLFSYYLVSCFSFAKLDSAIVEVAKLTLGESLTESFSLVNNKYDKKSILFTLFTIDPNLLKDVFHFNKIQKRSFSSFALKNPTRQKSTSFKDFLSKEVLQKVLKQHDLSENDDLESQFQGFFYRHNRIYVFIRRASSADLLLYSNRVVHGYKPDWVIFDFAPNANQVNLCTKNIGHGLKIASKIVSLYFEHECCLVDVHNQNAVALVQMFLISCMRKLIPGVNMYELRFTLLESEHSNYLTLTTKNIEELLHKIEPVVGNVLDDVSLVQHIKLTFREKKVTLSFQSNVQNHNYIAINYSEHVLNKAEREDFKSLVKDSYGLTILSKTKSCYL